jgi:hypothetical protein
VTSLSYNAWLRDIVGVLTLPVLMQYVQVRESLESFVLDPSSPDNTVWCWCSSGIYSVSLVYSAMFHGPLELQGVRHLWKVKAHAEFKFFFLLALQHRCWTSQRLHQHRLSSDSSCALCLQCDESINHLLLGYVFSREVWTLVLRPLGWHHALPSVDSCLGDWWIVTE